MVCAYCNKELNKTTGEINRASKAGLKLYCNRKCSGLARRKNLTIDQKKEQKRLYDIEYRTKNLQSIKTKKAVAFKKDYTENPDKYKKKRKLRYKKHLEYLRTEKYREYKKEYDQKYLAKKHYGEFWESKLILNNIELHVDNFEVKQQLQLINKSQKRKRNYEKFKREELETNTLGNPK